MHIGDIWEPKGIPNGPRSRILDRGASDEGAQGQLHSGTQTRGKGNPTMGPHSKRPGTTVTRDMAWKLLQNSNPLDTFAEIGCAMSCILHRMWQPSHYAQNMKGDLY